MAIFDFLKAKPGDVADLERQLARLLEEKAKVTAEVESYGQRRADMLLSSADDDAIVKFDADHAKASVRLERLEVGEMALIERIADLRDRQAREAEARRRERTADDLEQRAVAIEKTIDTLATQLDEFIAATDAGLIETPAYKEMIGRGAALTPHQAAAAALASSLFNGSPDLFDVSGRGRDGLGLFFNAGLPVRYMKPGSGVCAELPRHDEPKFPPFLGMVAAVLIAPMRERARELRGSDDVREAAE